MGTSFTKLRYYFSTNSPSSTLFFTFRWDSVCRQRKTLCWSVGAVEARRVSSRRHRPQNSPQSASFSGPKKGLSRTVLNRDCGEDEDWFAFLFGRIFEFLVLTSLMSAHIAVNCGTSFQEFHQQDSFTVPEDASHTFTLRSLHLEFVLPQPPRKISIMLMHSATETRQVTRLSNSNLINRCPGFSSVG
jgi:hypothetical protein